MKVGFIGAGKVGTSIGKYMTEHGVELSGYYSKSMKSAQWAADFTGATCYREVAELVNDSDLLFLTVPDGEIANVAGLLLNMEIEGKCICHCSGAETSAVFETLREKGAYGYSIHPICAVSSREFGYNDLKEACFTVEGDEKYLAKLHKLFQNFGNPVERIQPEMKVKYHMAAVFASNLVVGLYENASKMLEECGLSKEFSQSALIPLFINNAQNVAQKGTVQSLTGPVERADIGTIEKHLQASSGEQQEIYRLLSRSVLDVARQKNPDRDYADLQRLLEQSLD